MLCSLSMTQLRRKASLCLKSKERPQWADLSLTNVESQTLVALGSLKEELCFLLSGSFKGAAAIGDVGHGVGPHYDFFPEEGASG